MALRFIAAHRVAIWLVALLTCLWPRAGSAEGCQATLDDLSAYVQWGIQSFQVMDAAGFAEARLEARRSLECLSEPLFPEEALGFHLLEALDAYMARDERRVVLAFRAVVAGQDAYDLPFELAPPGNPLRHMFEEARAAPPSSETPLFQSTSAILLVDGLVAEKRPADRPVILQWVGADGDPLWTGYLLPGTPIPVSVIALATEPEQDEASLEEPPPVAAVSPLPVESLPSAQVESRAPSGAKWVWASAGSFALSGGLLAAALLQRSQWQDELETCVAGGPCAVEQAELDGMEARARGLGYGFQVSAGLGLGFGLAAVVTMPW